MPPAMARPRAFSKNKQQKEELKDQTSRDTDRNVMNYRNVPGTKYLWNLFKSSLFSKSLTNYFAILNNYQIHM